MLYLYPYIAIYRGPKKGEELRKYLISHMKNMDIVSEKIEKINPLFKQAINSINQNQSAVTQQVQYLRNQVKFLQQVKEQG